MSVDAGRLEVVVVNCRVNVADVYIVVNSFPAP